MTEHDKVARHQALEEGADWLVRLSSQDLQDDEVDAWNAWMEASPLHVQAFEDVSLLWDAAGEVGSERVLAARAAAGGASLAQMDIASVEAPLPEAPSVTEAMFRPRPTTIVAGHLPVRRTRVRRWWAMAASVAGLALGAGILQWQWHRPGVATEMHLASGVGAPRKVDLPDGSHVDLDADSEVVVQFSTQRRQVELVKGQVYFSVAKDPACPFEVRADGALAQALGTHFSVAKRTDSVRVVVREGHVQVSDLRANAPGGANYTVQLLADQGATLVEDGPLKGPIKMNAGSAVAWLQGRVVYRGETLGNVVADLNRYSSTPIVLGDQQLAQLKVTGRWSTSDLETWLDSMAQALSLSIERQPHEIRLVPAASGAHWSNTPDGAPQAAASVRR